MFYSLNVWYKNCTIPLGFSNCTSITAKWIMCVVTSCCNESPGICYSEKFVIVKLNCFAFTYAWIFVKQCDIPSSETKSLNSRPLKRDYNVAPIFYSVLMAKLRLLMYKIIAQSTVKFRYESPSTISMFKFGHKNILYCIIRSYTCMIFVKQCSYRILQEVVKIKLVVTQFYWFCWPLTTIREKWIIVYCSLMINMSWCPLTNDVIA